MSGYVIDLDRDRLQIDVIHGVVADSYWARGMPRALLERAIANSICVGAYQGDVQVGFARVITDRATFAYLADLFVLDAHRGNHLATEMVAALHAHPELQGLRRWMLATRDAHPVYAKLGWTPVAQPELFMQRHDPDVYLRAGE
ncbi:GNAT family N-acetyltransferase [Sphingomonas sp.]|uniref:GNAT family N-acetyltransferase n=1 Tax=Sphingomonas sp. TaxID=28214 RepID=UPI001801FB22|nr:GNAT family N-acetyltransferase [Sphingomonas sp.]MBA4761884.1 GNAT family N-acetyltransferase [Sphingomonas sp.]